MTSKWLTQMVSSIIVATIATTISTATVLVFIAARSIIVTLRLAGQLVTTQQPFKLFFVVLRVERVTVTVAVTIVSSIVDLLSLLWLDFLDLRISQGLNMFSAFLECELHDVS